MISATDVLQALPTAVYLTDPEGRITFYNDAAAEFWGHKPELGTDRWCGSWKLFWPDGRPLPHDECPMAIAIKEGRELRGVEAVAERPDGTRRAFIPYPTLLRDSEGAISGAINLLVDITDRKGSELEAARLAAIVSSSDDIILSKSLDGRIATWNASAERIFGYTAEEAIGQHITLIIPPELRHEEDIIIGKIKAGERVEHFDTVRVAKNGQRVDVSLSVSPVLDSNGRVIGASKVARDVTERKESERLQRLLFDELNHRVKNTLAMIQSLAAQSLRRASNPTEFVTSFNGRTQALARAHDLLVGSKMRGADLVDILREQVLLGSAPDGQRTVCSGPRVMLDSRSTVQLGLVLHELATNARKYGALGPAGGRLEIRWHVDIDDEQRTLQLHWQERDVANVKAPSRQGFGSTLIERSLQANDGDAALTFNVDGLTCEISLPLGNQHEDEGRRDAEVLSALPMESLGEGLAGKRILVIEDEPLIAMEVEAILAAARCQLVGPASTIGHAKRLIAEEDFDAAVVDANLFGAKADELAAALAKRGVPFIFATGYGRAALPAAFADRPFLAKPFAAAALLGTLEAVLDRTGGTIIPLPSRRRT